MIVGMMRMEILNMNNVTNRTRAGDSGKEIVCPFCDTQKRVYHFSWSALWCQTCDTKVDKPDWRLASAN